MTLLARIVYAHCDAGCRETVFLPITALMIHHSERLGRISSYVPPAEFGFQALPQAVVGYL